ncbi:uncharacterized protein LOC134220388 [Armigeres subalbatus]|uniref:uncharacterized protein LOC134220388 n=1 Tax=Armigeres subalbatus TaxID=124917 RepID=UPI002ED34828
MLLQPVDAVHVLGRTAAIFPVGLLMMTIIPWVSPGLGGNGSVSIQHRLYQSKQMLMDSEAQFLALDESHKKLGDGLIRSARRGNREPKFVSFHTKNDNIEVEIDFAIPFLTIPVQESVSGVMGSIMKGVPALNVNVGAVILAGFLAIGGALLGVVMRFFKSHGMMGLLGPMKPTEKQQRASDFPDLTTLWSLMEAVDRSLQKFDIDATACTQRTVCWYVKEAMNNVIEDRASKMDTVINGLSEADWALKFTTGTAIEDAIHIGRRNLNCEQAFPSCRIKAETVQRILRHTKTRK